MLNPDKTRFYYVRVPEKDVPLDGYSRALTRESILSAAWLLGLNRAAIEALCDKLGIDENKD